MNYFPRLFVMVSGSVYVDVENDKTGQNDRVNTIEATPDSTPIFGESSILDELEHYRTATLICAVNCQLMEISKQNYFILEKNGDLVDEGENAEGKSSLHEALRKQANKARARLKKKGVSSCVC